MSSHCARLLLLLAFVSALATQAADELRLIPVTAGLDHITSIANAGDRRLFIVEQTGLIRVFDGERLLDSPLVDLRASITCCGERGLLSIAFHPQFQENGLLFVSYTDTIGRVTVERFRISADDPNRVDETSRVPIIQILHIKAAHNGGQLAFGPDGYLYLGVGDGGQNGDSDNNAQDLTRYLGKILRIDVDHGDSYSIPESNPFANRGEGTLGEIWAYGLRNPWRFSFDRATGDLWIADVGETATEEIDLQAATSSGGQNYGWNLMEGTDCRNGGACDEATLTMPVIIYHHDNGCAVIGGYRYRGKAEPLLHGMYLYADYCSGRIWTATQNGDGTWSSYLAGTANARVRTFGEDAEGELYIGTEDGMLWRIATNVSRLRSFRTGH